MSIIVEDATCTICGRLFSDGSELVAFPPFVANQRDSLYRFSDRVFHRACLERIPEGQRALVVLELYISAVEKVCVVCGKVVIDPDDYFGTGFLSDDDERSGLSAFNFLHFHRSHFREWPLSTTFQGAASSWITPGTWDGPALDFDPDGPRWRRKARAPAA